MFKNVSGFLSYLKYLLFIVLLSSSAVLAAPFVISVNNAGTATGGTGTTMYWNNAGTVGGVPISLRATVVNISAGDTVSLRTSGDNPLVTANTSTLEAEILWEAFAQGTTTPILGDPRFLITDLDGSNGTTIESVSALCQGLTAYSTNGIFIEGVNANTSPLAQSNIRISEAGGDILAEGTQAQSGSQQEGYVQFNWTAVSSWTVKYFATSRGRWFVHDGDGDVPFDGTEVLIPLIDLATIKGTAPGSLTSPGVGEEITYEVVMSNAGPSAAHNAQVTDQLPIGLDYVSSSVTEGNYNVATGVWGGVDLNVGESQTLLLTGRVQAGQQGNTITNTILTATADESKCSSRDVLTYAFTVNYLPELNITKSISSGSPYTAVGDVVSYDYFVENIGDASISNIVVTDDKIASVSCPLTTLAPSTSTTCTASYSILQVDIDNASVTNNASVTGTPVGGTLTPATSSATAVLLPQPSLTIVKDVDSTNILAPSTLNYTIDVNNTGNVTLTNVTIVDTLPNGTPGTLSAVTGDTDNDNQLDVGEVWRYIISYPVTQVEIDAGIARVNSVSVTTAETTTAVVDTATTTITKSPSMAVLKEVDIANVTAPTTVNYTITVENTGNVSLTNVSPVDTLANGGTGTLSAPSGDTDLDNAIDIDETWVYTLAYPITQVEIDAGTARINTVSVTTTEITTAQTSAASTTISRTPLVAMKKTAGTPTIAQGFDATITDEDDTITYTLDVSNTGNVSLHDVLVSDSIATVSSCALTSNGDAFANDGSDTLDVGESVSCTVIYTLTNADLDTGGKGNTATVDALDPSNAPLSSSDTITSALTQKSAIALVKSAGLPTITGGLNNAVVDAGDTVSYEFNVTNTSNVTLTNVTVEDVSLTMSLDCGSGSNVIASMAAGMTATCTSMYTLTQDDIDGLNAPTVTNTAGTVEINNEANATGTPPVGSGLTPPVATSSAQATLQVNAALAFEKTAGSVVDASGDGLDSAGDTITYTYKVENTGVTTLKDVNVTETVFTGTGVLPTPTVSSGDPSSVPQRGIVIFTGTYTLTQADIDTGIVSNTAVGSGAPFPAGMAAPTGMGSAAVNLNASPELNITKTASKTTDVVVGDVITYTYTVGNGGNVGIDNVSVSDVHSTGNLSAITLTSASANLAPAEVATFTATYTVTQADIDTGTDITNTATATGTPKRGILTDVSDGEVVTIIAASPELNITKTASKTTDVVVGDVITYTYDVTNIGNVGIDSIVISDVHSTGNLSAITLTSASANLAPAEVATFTATYTVTQADIDTGTDITNTATATGTPKRGILTDVSDGEVVTIIAASPELNITKTASKTTDVVVGDVITYTYTVGNGGNVGIDNVSVSDVHSTGNLSAITLTSASANLAPAEVATFTATYTVTQADIDTGTDITNTATATGTPKRGILTDVSDGEVVTIIAASPELNITKTASKTTDVVVGDVITYTYDVTNIGNVGIDSIVISDIHSGTGTLSAPSGGTSSLLPGEDTAFTATYTVTQEDIDAGIDINNTATANATAQRGVYVPVSDRESVKVVDSISTISIVKSAGVPTIVNGVDANITDEGDTITYSLTVQNTGNVTLHDVLVTDTITTISSCVYNVNGSIFDNSGTGVLPVAQSVTCTAEYTLVNVDLNSGVKDNNATVTAKDPSNTVVDASDSTSSVLTQKAAIVLLKNAALPTVTKGANAAVVDAGDTIAYTFNVTNTSNVTLTNVIVEDMSLNMSLDCGGGTNTITSVAAGDTVICTSEYTLTLDDLNGNNPVITIESNGTLEVNNEANVTGTPPVGSGLTAPAATASALATAQISTSLGFEKTVSSVIDVNGDNIDSAGDKVTYNYKVGNTGVTTLSDVTVTEGNFTGTGTNGVLTVVSGNAVSLLPAEIVVFTSEYTLTQEDIDAGIVSNTATASATPPSSMAPPTGVASAAVSFNQISTYNMTKNSDTPIILAPGTITYTFTFENFGNITLKNLGLTDLNIDVGTLTCEDDTNTDLTIDTLAPGDSRDCTATRIVTQAEIDAGLDIVNTAIPSAVDSFDVVVDEDNDASTGTPNDPSDNTETTIITQSPELNITKIADKTLNVGVGETITYTYVVTNIGNVTIDELNVTDAHSGTGTLSDMNQSDITLAPNESTMYSATYVVTQEDVDAGTDITNTATVDGSPKGGTLTPPTASETVDLIDRISSFTMSKASTATDAQVGDSLPYTFTVVNTGNATLTTPTITDTKCVATPSLATESLTADTRLEVGETQTYTCNSIPVTQTEVDAGEVLNAASINATPPAGAPVPATQEANATVPVTQTPAYTFEKSTASVPTQAGNTLVYNFEVNNTGNVSLSTITIADSKCDVLGISLDAESMDADTILQVGETQTYSCTSLAVLQAEVDAGEVNNTASITVDVPPSATALAGQSSMVSTPIVPTPALSMIKTASEDTNLVVGQTITYTYEVNNTGNVTLDDVTVTDNHLGAGTLSAIIPTSVTLAPSQVQLFTASYTVTQEDIDNGVTIDNTATVTATPKGGTLTDVNATESVDVADPIPAVSITKEADKTIDVKVNDVITYTYTVENIGNVGIDNVSVSDVHVADGVLSAITTTDDTNLAPTEEAKFTATYTVTQADIDLGNDINNTATATGTAKLGTLTDVNVSESVDLEGINPQIYIAKVASAPTVVNGVENNITDADDNITYTITLENSGNVSLFNVQASDSITTIDSCGLTSNGDIFNNNGTDSLDVGERVLCTAVYTLTTADLDAGSRSNTATVSSIDMHGTPADNSTTVSSSVTQTASIVLVKTADDAAVQSPAQVGDVISYSFEVRNTSNVTLTSVVLTDNALGVAPFNMAVDCGGSTNIIASMPAQSTALCTGTYALTQDDIDGVSAPTITNTAGIIEITNDANVTGVPPVGSGLTPPTASASALAEANASASLSMAKTAGAIVDTNADGVDSVGDTIPYTYTVKNEGTTTLANVSVEENASTFTGTGTLPTPTVSVGDASSLAPNDTVVFTATYVLTQEDIDAGFLNNTASASGETSPPNGMLPPTASSSIAVVIMQNPSFSMEKVVTPTTIAGPTTLDYTFTFENTGNVTLYDINLSDANIDSGTLTGCPIATLNVGEVVTCTASKVITQEMIDSGVDIINIASANAQDPLGQTTDEDNDNNESTANDPSDNTTVTTITQSPSLSIVKTADKTANVSTGEIITYTYEVNNTGNITIDNINVTDVHSGRGTLSDMNQTDITLAPGEGTFFSTTYVVTQEDVDAGDDIVNTATADGDARGGILEPVEDSVTVSVAPAVADIALIKQVIPQSTPYAIGDVINYTFEVKNVGNVTLYGVNVSDSNASMSGSPITLSPNQEDNTTFTATHLVTQVDIDRGTVINQAQVTAQDAQGNSVEDLSDNDVYEEDDPTITPIIAMPGIHITKLGTFDSNASVQVGDTVSYEFNVTNTGNVTLTDVIVEDANAVVAGGSVSLDPGESDMTTFTAVHTVTQDDIDANEVVNQAEVKAKDPSGNDVNASSDDPTTTEDMDATVTPLLIAPPTVTPDEVNGTTGQAEIVNVLANDIVGTFALDPSSVHIIAPNGDLVKELIVVGEGVWSVNPDGTITFTPNADFTGDPTPIKYTVNDIQGNPVTMDGEIKIDYPPVAVDDIGNSLVVEPITIDILANDKNTSYPFDLESVSLVSPSNATDIITDAEGDIIGFTVDEGVWSVDETTGMVTFTPANSFIGGDVPSIAYTVQETDGMLRSNPANITVEYASQRLEAVDDGTITITHYGATVIDVLSNDSDTNVSIEITQQPEHGTVEVVIGDDGRPHILYTPDPDINNVPDAFKYTITDAFGQTSEASVILDVQCATTQSSDGGDTLSTLGIMMMIFLTGMTGLYFVRKEEERGEA